MSAHGVRESTCGSELRPFSFSSLWYMCIIFGRRIFQLSSHFVSFIMFMAVVVVACSCSGSVQSSKRRSTITINPSNNKNYSGSHHCVEYRLCKCINRTTTLSLFFCADLDSFWVRLRCFGICTCNSYTISSRATQLLWQHLKNSFYFDIDCSFCRRC